MKLLKLKFIFYSILLLNIAILNGVSRGGSSFWGAPYMDAARRWLSTTQSLPHSTSRLDADTAEILQSIGETARARMQEADQATEGLPQAHAEQNSAQTLIEQRDEALRQLEPALRREGSSLVRTIAERYFSRTISLDDLAGPADELDHVVSSLNVITITGSATMNRRITREQIQQIGQRFPHLRELVLQNARLGNDGLRVLSQQPFAGRLTNLYISGNNITSAGLNAMGAFTSLTSLDISGNEIGDAGLRILSELPFASELTLLNITKTSITLNGLLLLNKFRSLKELKIAKNQLEDRGFALLSEQPIARRLTGLYLSHNGITAASIQYLSSFSELRELIISGNPIGNEGLAALAQLPIASQLTALEISDTGITLQGLNNLRAFTGLQSLSIAANRLGDEGLRIVSALPYAHNLVDLNIGLNNISTKAAQKYKSAFNNIKTYRVGI